jgi:hypothetical protein
LNHRPKLRESCHHDQSIWEIRDHSFLKTYPCAAGEWCDEANDACVAYGDGDFDGDLDLFDYSWFQACFGQLAVGGCEPGNMTGSETIELDDFTLFVAGLGGPQ